MKRRWPIALLLLAAAAGIAVLAIGRDGDSESAQPAERSAPQFLASDSRSAAEVWAVGDAADGGRAAERVAKMVIGERPDRFLYLGDVYEDGTAEEFERNYEPLYGELKQITAPTPGNHEWPNHEEGYDPYWRESGHPTEHWYSFRTAGWEIISLNSEEDHGPRSPQVRWARREVREGGTCRIAIWHRPYLSASRHGDQEDVAPLWRAVRGRAALVLSGNDHTMQHFKPRDGLVQLVSGAGGRELYSSNENDPRLVWDEDDEFGALRLDLRPGLARFRFVDDGGKTLHRGQVECKRK